MRPNAPPKRGVALAAIFLALFCSPLLSAPGRFYTRIAGGASFPTLTNLNSELALQGQKEVGAGYAFGASFGYALLEERYSLELHFAAHFYPSFDYYAAKIDAASVPPDTTVFEDFRAGLKHYGFLLVARHNFMSESEKFRPTLGAGIGYGQTHLITGGGKLGAPEGLITASLDISIRSHIEIGLECSYYSSLQTKRFKNPFLENFETDVVRNSSGEPLEDRFHAFDVRIGLTIWLKPMTQ